MAPLEGWNVDAVWFTGDRMIFGCTHESEGPVFEQIAVWDWTTGRWWTSPRELALGHRGFKLRETLPDWRQARAGRVGDAVLLQGGGTTLILTPDTKGESGSWSLTDLEGRWIGPSVHKVARRLVPVTDDVRARLRAPLLAAFREWNHGVDSVVILEALQGPCLGQPEATAILAMGMAPRPSASAVDSPDINAILNGQLFGLFLADGALGAIRSRIDMFPTARYGDYVIYFDLDAPDNAMVIWGQGEMYGDEEIQRGYTCGN